MSFSAIESVQIEIQEAGMDRWGWERLGKKLTD